MTDTTNTDEQPEQEPAQPKVRELPLVALRETVIFPEMIVPLQVGRDKSVQALNKAVADSSPIALVTQRQADVEDISDPSELYSVGTLAKIAQVVQLQDGTVRAIVQGQQRVRLLEFVESEPFILARIETVEEQPASGLEVQALVRSVQGQIEQYVQSGAPVPPEAAVAARNITEPGLLADMVAYSPDMSTEQRQELLETIDVHERLKLVSSFLARQVEILKQGQYQPMPVENQVCVIYAATNGYLDEVAVDHVRRWERGFHETLAAKHQGVLDRIRTEGKLSDELTADLVSAIKGYNASFAAEHEGARAGATV